MLSHFISWTDFVSCLAHCRWIMAKPDNDRYVLIMHEIICIRWLWWLDQILIPKLSSDERRFDLWRGNWGRAVVKLLEITAEQHRQSIATTLSLAGNIGHTLDCWRTWFEAAAAAAASNVKQRDYNVMFPLCLEYSQRPFHISTRICEHSQFVLKL